MVPNSTVMTVVAIFKSRFLKMAATREIHIYLHYEVEVQVRLKGHWTIFQFFLFFAKFHLSCKT